MFKWLWQCSWISCQDKPEEIEDDAVYGLSRRAIDDWLAMNPELAAEHKTLEKLARERRCKSTGKQSDVQRK